MTKIIYCAICLLNLIFFVELTGHCKTYIKVNQLSPIKSTTPIEYYINILKVFLMVCIPYIHIATLLALICCSSEEGKKRVLKIVLTNYH